MKHAGADALTMLGPLLERLRGVEGLREVRPGVFYLKSRAFLHFHEDPTGLYADFRPPWAADFQRLPADGAEGVAALIAIVEAAAVRR